MIHVLIMAGGQGTRFWPLSRKSKPKQFLNVLGDKSLLKSTIERVEKIIPYSQRWVLGNQTQSKHLDQLTNLVPTNQILKEPIGKNTAACIGWGAFEILKKDPEAICVILSADAWIQDEAAFQECLQNAITEVNQNDSVVTIGIPPTSPHTGYGYIEVSNKINNIYGVKSFKEKPTKEKALFYLTQKNYYWNAGIFIWKAKKIKDLFQAHLPKHFHILSEMRTDNIEQQFSKFENISIDYGVLEKIGNQIKLIPATFQWSDIGSWSALDPFIDHDENKNTRNKSYITVNAKNNSIYSKKCVALAGVNDLIIVDTDDALLILNKENDQDIKLVYDQLDDDLK